MFLIVYEVHADQSLLLGNVEVIKRFYRKPLAIFLYYC